MAEGASPFSRAERGRDSERRLDPCPSEPLRDRGHERDRDRPLGASLKSVDDIPKEEVATVITLCPKRSAPVFPGAVEKLHCLTPTPAGAVGSKEEILESFRRVRDQIRAKLVAFFER